MRLATQIEMSQNVIRDAVRPALQHNYVGPVVVQHSQNYCFEKFQVLDVVDTYKIRKLRKFRLFSKGILFGLY